MFDYYEKKMYADVLDGKIEMLIHEGRPELVVISHINKKFDKLRDEIREIVREELKEISNHPHTNSPG